MLGPVTGLLSNLYNWLPLESMKILQNMGLINLCHLLFEDLKTLYCDGLTISVAGQKRVFYGGLLAFLADNLAAHLVGGFKQSMSFALGICRGCMVTHDLSQKCITETDCVLRSADTHFEQCMCLTSRSTVGPFFNIIWNK